MTRVTSWADFRRAVRKQLQPDGERGFEGFIAALLSAATGLNFAVARRGTQPVGDAFSLSGASAIQAKHYFASAVREHDIAADFERILAEFAALELYVVATTRADAQLRQRMAKITRERAIDALVLELSDDGAELGALCAAHWAVVERFVGPFDEQSRRWAERQAKEPGKMDLVAEIVEDLRGQVTYTAFAENAAKSLNLRTCGLGYGRRTHNAVNLAQSVPRRVEATLQAWWRDSVGTAVIEAEEGFGKTWLAARFANQVATQGAIVLWLDSQTWSAAKDLTGLLDLAVDRILQGQSDVSARLQRKALSLWSSPVLFVLDGANEQGAWAAADALLGSYEELCSRGTGPVGSFSRRFRLLFTTRPLGGRTSARNPFWHGCTIVSIQPFDDSEFRTALASLGKR